MIITNCKRLSDDEENASGFGDDRALPLVFILSVFIWDLQCKNHFNRKMVFRVTKSQSIKDKLSFI